MGQVIHPQIPDFSPDDINIDKQQKDCKYRAINSNFPFCMYPLINTYPNNHRVDSNSDIDDCDTSLNHISTQNLNQTNVTGDHENYCGHSKLNILSLNCGIIGSQTKRNNLAVLLSEHNIIAIVLGCEFHIDEP